jgi:hypothetical protein
MLRSNELFEKGKGRDHGLIEAVYELYAEKDVWA